MIHLYNMVLAFFQSDICVLLLQKQSIFRTWVDFCKTPIIWPWSQQHRNKQYQIQKSINLNRNTIFCVFYFCCHCMIHIKNTSGKMANEKQRCGFLYSSELHHIYKNRFFVSGSRNGVNTVKSALLYPNFYFLWRGLGFRYIWFAISVGR